MGDGGMLTTKQHRGRGLPKKGGLGLFADLRLWGGGTWQEREGNVFEG